MEIITKNQLFEQKKKTLDKIKKGAVFIYPTDTIYGIGCDATNAKAVERIRRIKKRDTKPFSVIAPSKKWIRDWCETKHAEKWIKKLPGPYTLILKLKGKRGVSRTVTHGRDTIAVRIPAHWFTSFARQLKIPIVTTSVNRSGKKHMTSLDDVHASIKNSVDFIIYEGKKKGRPSTLIALHDESSKVISR